MKSALAASFLAADRDIRPLPSCPEGVQQLVKPRQLFASQIELLPISSVRVATFICPHAP